MLTKLMPNIYLSRQLGTVYFSVEKSTLPWLTAPPMSAGEWSLFSHEMLWECGQLFQVAKSSFSTLSARSGSRLDLSKSEEQVFRSFSNIIFWFSKLLCDPVQKNVTRWSKRTQAQRWLPGQRALLEDQRVLERVLVRILKPGSFSLGTLSPTQGLLGGIDIKFCQMRMTSYWHQCLLLFITYYCKLPNWYYLLQTITI